LFGGRTAAHGDAGNRFRSGTTSAAPAFETYADLGHEHKADRWPRPISEIMKEIKADVVMHNNKQQVNRCSEEMPFQM
jgi:hypothetical protein